MKRESAFLMVLLILLVGSSFTALGVQKVEASGTVYIRADGSIDPPHSPISTVDNVTYTLTGNITTYADGIVVERDNIVLNGSGYTVMGSGNGNGTTLTNRRNVTVNNMMITDFTDGIVLESSSDNNVLSGNTLVNDNYGFGIYLESCSNNSISGNNIKKSGDGIWLNSSSDNRIDGNNITDNAWSGIRLSSSSDNRIDGNNITNNGELGRPGGGVLLFSSSNNTISENIINANSLSFGIIFRVSSNNTFSENIITNNWLGISLEYKSKLPNSPIVYSSDNVIYHNSFINNLYQALGGLRNVWDDGYPSGGNYWSDYKGTDADHDGVGDTPYVIDANNTDYYPLMNLYVQSGAVYIRADGSIDPPHSPISTVDNVTYTLTGNIASDAGIVIERDSILVDGQGYTVQGTWRGTGITLSGRSNVTIKNTEITAFIFGIWLSYSSNNSISGNDVAANSWVGIKLENCLNINIVNNDITDNDLAGIWLFFSNSSLVSQNRITRTHTAGIILDISSNNTILENDVRDNNANIVFEYSVNGGVALSSHNRILHNNFINSTWNAITYFSGQPENFWDDGYPSGGNYWSDYNGTDADYDGIGDTEYTIDASNIDHYPLMGMFHSYNVTYYTASLVPHVCDATVISNSTISGFVTGIWIEHPEVIFLQFNVSGAEGSNGFCRVSFPTAMMNGTYHVSLNGTEIPYTLLPCSDANTSYLYFNYTHSTQEVIIIPEFPSLLILPLFMVASLLAAIFYRRKRPESLVK